MLSQVALIAATLVSALPLTTILDLPVRASEAPFALEASANASIKEAADQVVDVFAAAGFQVHLKVEVVLHEGATLTIPQISSALGAATALGFFDRRRGQVHVLGSATGKVRRTYWRQPWNDELSKSFLRHEFAHVAVDSILGLKFEMLPPAWHEFLAYAVQFDLMNVDLRNRILSEHSTLRPFEDLGHVNDIVYGFNPETFAIRAYRTYVAQGRTELLRRVLDFKIDWVDLRQYYY